MNKFLSLLIALFFCAGCSTIMKEDWEELIIETKPAGAEVALNNGQSCHTPCTLELDRGEDYSVTVSKTGFKTEKKEVKGNSWDGWLWGNIAFIYAFPLGVAYDFYTGYAYDFSPDKIEFEMQHQ